MSYQTGPVHLIQIDGKRSIVRIETTQDGIIAITRADKRIPVENPEVFEVQSTRIKIWHPKPEKTHEKPAFIRIIVCEHCGERTAITSGDYRLDIAH